MHHKSLSHLCSGGGFWVPYLTALALDVPQEVAKVAEAPTRRSLPPSWTTLLTNLITKTLPLAMIIHSSSISVTYSIHVCTLFVVF